MSNIPQELKYVESHEWLRKEEDGSYTVGITDFAQEQLGDVVFVELPEEGAEVAIEEDIAVVESVKAASDIYAPISGKIVAINEALLDEPEKVNEDAYGDAWFFRIEPTNAAELDALLSADDYAAKCE